MTYSIVTESTGVTCITIRGALDAGTLPTVRPEIENLLSGHPRRILVDFSELRLIDTSGVAMLIRMYKRCRQAGGALALSGLHGQPRAILKLLRLDRMMASSELELQ